MVLDQRHSPNGRDRSPKDDVITLRRAGLFELDGIMRELTQSTGCMMDKEKLRFIIWEKFAYLYAVVNSSRRRVKTYGYISYNKTREGEAVLGNFVIRQAVRQYKLEEWMLERLFRFHPGGIVSTFTTETGFFKQMGWTSCSQIGVHVTTTLNRDKLTRYCERPSRDRPVRVEAYTDAIFEELLVYDALVRGYDNRRFLQLVTKTADRVAVAVEADGDLEEKDIDGYVALKMDESTGTLVLNGFFADSDRIASILLKDSLDNFQGAVTTKFFTLVNCQYLLLFSQSAEAVKQWRFCYGGRPAAIPEEKVYCLSEPDLTT